MDLRDSPITCPYCHKRLAIDAAEEEGQRMVAHRCLNCTYTLRAPARPRRGTGSPYMTELREKVWDG